VKRCLLFMCLWGGRVLAIPTPPAIGSPPPLPAATLPAPPKAAEPTLDVQSLSYETAPLLALANNPRVSVSLANVREALAKSEVSAAPARPQGLLGLQGPPIPVGGSGTFRNDYVLSPIRVELRQLIFDGGRILSLVEQGKSLARQQALQAQSDWQELYFEVRRSYLTVLARQGNVSLAEQQVRLAQEQLRQAEIRFKVGKAPRGDVLSAALPVAQAEVTLQKKQGEYRKSQQELNQLLGLAQTTPLKLQKPELPSEPIPELKACLQEALSKRPSLLALQYQVEASLRQIEAGESDNAPYVNLLLGIAAVSQGTQILGAAQYRGGFEVNWQFADGGKAGHLADAARAVRDRSLAMLKEQRSKVELEVRDAYRDLETAVETHRSEQVRVAKARDALRISQAQYRAGMVTIYPVRQAQQDFYEAQQAEIQAYYDYFLALARLDMASGRSGGTRVDTPWPED